MLSHWRDRVLNACLPGVGVFENNILKDVTCLLVAVRCEMPARCFLTDQPIAVLGLSGPCWDHNNCLVSLEDSAALDLGMHATANNEMA